MTTTLQQKVLDISAREVGYREGPHNNETKYGADFGFNFVAWCAIFCSTIYKWAGVTYLGKTPRYASTIAWRDNARKNGRWSQTPRVGDVAMMAHSSSTGHVGIVIGWSPNYSVIYTREGNTNDQGGREGNGVWNRARSRGSWDGFIQMDDWGGSSPIQPSPPPTGNRCGDPAGHPLLKRGARGPAVNHLQYLLQRTGSTISGDGDFGPATESAVRNFQTWAKLTSDGVVGPQTWGTLHRHVDGLSV